MAAASEAGRRVVTMCCHARCARKGPSEEGNVPLLSLHALEQIHIFIFVLAITHVVLSGVTVLLGPLQRSLFKQFYGSVSNDDYIAMRLGFVMLLLLIGTKLEHIINKLAYEVASKHAAGQGEGGVVVRPSDELFWFHSPRLVLVLIHFILFQNAFEFAYFFWTLVSIRHPADLASTVAITLTAGCDVRCLLLHDEQAGYSISRIAICVVVQVLCSYSTLPLYAIVSHMGSSFKSAVFADDVAEHLRDWADGARRRMRSDTAGDVSCLALPSHLIGSTLDDHARGRADPIAGQGRPEELEIGRRQTAMPDETSIEGPPTWIVARSVIVLISFVFERALHRLGKGEVPLLSLHALEQIHIFIFVLAITHVVLSAVTVLLGLLQQFYGSVSNDDYVAMRLGFVMEHIRGHPKFNFYDYMIKAVEKDFKRVVGITWYHWIFVMIFLLFNISGYHSNFWISLIPLALLLLIGAKLEHIINMLAYEVATKHFAADEEGDVDMVVSPLDELFWFQSPRVVLTLIHFILFQNAFEFAYFFWTLATFGVDSCMMDGPGIII
ncbi:MLO-like protein 1, partial [Dichanthelium oligosanthes]